MPKLTVFLPESGEVHFDLPSDGVLTLGRVADNDLQVEDGSVSSHHAEVHVRGGRVTIKDLGSTNGTTINGSEVSESPLKPGDTLFFGSIQAQLAGDATGGSQPLPELPSESEFVAPAFSARPAGFANASPYPKKRASMDGPSKGILALAGLALLAAGAAVFLSLQMAPPTM